MTHALNEEWPATEAATVQQRQRDQEVLRAVLEAGARYPHLLVELLAGARPPITTVETFESCARLLGYMNAAGGMQELFSGSQRNLRGIGDYRLELPPAHADGCL